MRKAVFNTFNFSPAFLGPSLNMLQTAIDEGHQVYYVSCFKSFKSCGFNTFSLRYMCDTCEYRFNKAKTEIKGAYQPIRLVDFLKESDFSEVTKFFGSITAISKGTVYEDFDLGESVRSSYISKTRDRDIELEENEEILIELGKQTLLVYLATKRFFTENSIEELILFNGRWDYYRAAFRAAQALGIPVLVHENLRAGGYIETFENAFPHIIKNKQKNYDAFWNSASDTSTKKKIARNYFEKKRNGEVITDKAYSKNQLRSFLPAGMELKEKVIVLFTSSDDETVAIGGDEYTNPFFEDQSEGVTYVADLVGKNLPDFSLVIRMHPNLSGLSFDYLTPLYALKDKYPNVFLIGPDSKADSYALIDKAYKVISFGSTIGVEANYWRKPVILLSKAFYFHADVAHIPKDKSEILKLLTDDLELKKIESSEKIAFYLMEGGVKARYYNFEFGKDFFFKNLNLTKLPFITRNYFRILKQLKLRN